MMRGKGTLKTMLVLAGAAALLSACAAGPDDYDSSQFAYGYPVYQDPPYGYPAYGYFDFDRYWGGDWHRGWDHHHWHGGHH